MNARYFEYFKVDETKMQYQKIHKITCFLFINETEYKQLLIMKIMEVHKIPSM